MIKKSYRALILVLLYAHNGTWSWYQLERELDRRGLGRKISSTKVIDMLIKEGFIEEKQDPKNNTLTCFVTEAGKEKVMEFVNLYGAEAFKLTIENPDDYEL